MNILTKLVAAAVVGVAAAAFNFLYNYIHDEQRGLLMFFSLAFILVVALNRRGER